MLWALFWCAAGVVVLYALITDKKTRERVWEDLKRRARERERNKAYRRSVYSKRLEKYYRTGNRRYLYDDDFDE